MLWAIPAAAAAGSALGWIGSKIDDEGKSKYISKPIDWITGDSPTQGALAGALTPIGGMSGGWLAGKAGLGTSKYLAPAGWSAGGRIGGYLGKKGMIDGGFIAGKGLGRVAGARLGNAVGNAMGPLGGALGGLFGYGMGRFSDYGDDSSGAAQTAMLQQQAGAYGPQAPFTIGSMYPDLAASFQPAQLGWAPTPFGQQAPSTNIASYNNDEGLEGMLEDATQAANLPIKQAVKSRRDSQRKNIGVIKALGRDTQRDIEKSEAQERKAKESYEKLAAATEKEAMAERERMSKAYGDADMDRAKSVEERERRGVQRDIDKMTDRLDADREMSVGASDSLLDLLEGLGNAERYDVEDKVNREVVDAQDDVDALKQQMAANAARINTDYRAQLAGTNMDAAWNKYAMDQNTWDKMNYYGNQAAQSNMSALNAAKDRIQNIYSGMIGSGLLPGPYGMAGGGGGGAMVPSISANLDQQRLIDLANMGAIGMGPDMARIIGNAEVKWSHDS